MSCGTNSTPSTPSGARRVGRRNVLRQQFDREHAERHRAHEAKGPQRQLDLRCAERSLAIGVGGARHCVRFASVVTDDCATLASRRRATTYRGRSFISGNAPASPDAPELKFRIQSPPAASLQTFCPSAGSGLRYLIGEWRAIEDALATRYIGEAP